MGCGRDELAGPARREPRLACGTLEDRRTVAPFRAWRGWATRVAQGRDPRPADPTATLALRVPTISRVILTPSARNRPRAATSRVSRRGAAGGVLGGCLSLDHPPELGEMRERLNRHDWKSCEGV